MNETPWAELTPEAIAQIPVTNDPRYPSPWKESAPIILAVKDAAAPGKPLPAVGYVREHSNGTRDVFATGFAGPWTFTHYIAPAPIPVDEIEA